MDSLNNFLHNNFGLSKYRPSVKVRTDAFYEYIPADNPKDQKVITRLGNTIIELSDLCFRACVDPAHRYFTMTEGKCVRECVEGYFGGFQGVVEGTVGRIKKERQKGNWQQNSTVQPQIKK